MCTFVSVVSEAEQHTCTHTVDIAATGKLIILQAYSYPQQHSVKSLNAFGLLLFQMFTLNYLLLYQTFRYFCTLHLFARVQMEDLQLFSRYFEIQKLFGDTELESFLENFSKRYLGHILGYTYLGLPTNKNVRHKCCCIPLVFVL